MVLMLAFNMNPMEAKTVQPENVNVFFTGNFLGLNGSRFVSKAGSELTFNQKGKNKFELTGMSGCNFKIPNLVLIFEEETEFTKTFSFAKCNIDFLGGSVSDEFATLSYVLARGGKLIMDANGNIQIVGENAIATLKIEFKRS